MLSTLLKGSSKSLISGFALGAAVLFTSFNASAATATDNSLENFKYCEGGTKIDQETARKLIQNHGAVVIDVRSPEEYAKGHLKDAYLISFTLDQLAKQNLAEHELLKLVNYSLQTLRLWRELLGLVTRFPFMRPPYSLLGYHNY